jgi:hypothetical protein
LTGKKHQGFGGNMWIPFLSRKTGFKIEGDGGGISGSEAIGSDVTLAIIVLANCWGGMNSGMHERKPFGTIA